MIKIKYTELESVWNNILMLNTMNISGIFDKKENIT